MQVQSITHTVQSNLRGRFCTRQQGSNLTRVKQASLKRRRSETSFGLTAGASWEGMDYWSLV
eukprot:2849232-Amphidinium_carterae.1